MTRRLIPAEGRTVPQEDGSPWPTDAAGVPQPVEIDPAASQYIRRRLRDGDLIDAPAPAPAPKTKPAKEA